MEKITLNKVARYTTDKNGQPLKTRDGRPYTSLRIKSNEHGDKWLSGFDNPQTQNWKEGDTVEVEVTQKGEYLNFSVPKPQDKAIAEITGLKMTVSKHEFKIAELEICIEALAYKAGLKVKDLRALAEESRRGFAYPVNDMPEPDFDPDNSPF